MEIKKINQSIFKSYDFRGIYPTEINEQAIELIAQGYLKFLSEKTKKPIKELTLVLCSDARNSSKPLIESAKRIFLKYGVTIHDLGLQSINDYYFAVGKYKYDGGFMATASHNPPEYGGCKLAYYSMNDDNSIDFVSGKELRSYMEGLSFPLNEEITPGSIMNKDYLEEHLNHILSFINPRNIKPFKIVIDIGNGMNGAVAKKVFERIPQCEISFMFEEPNGDFPNRAPNPLTKGASEKVSSKIKEVGADFGFIFDVDGDRVNLLDENGSFYEGDLTLLPMAKSLLRKNSNAGIVYNLISSHIVKDLVKEWGGRPIRSEVGYMNLARHMKKEDSLMSGEVSAHFAFKDNFYADNAFIAMVLILDAMSEEEESVSQVMKLYKRYSRSSELNFTVKDRYKEIEKFKEKYSEYILDEIDGVTFEFKDWWFNVRPSGTEPLIRLTIETYNKEDLPKRIIELSALIESDD